MTPSDFDPLTHPATIRYAEFLARLENDPNFQTAQQPKAAAQ